MTTEAEVDPVRAALESFLKEDPVLKELATGVYYQLAPQNPEAELPYVIFENPTGNESWCFGGEPMEEGQVAVKGVGTPKQAESIDRRCKELLNSEELSIDGYDVLFVRSASIINYLEPSDGERFQHTGHNYDLIVEKKE
jgi:hypothetical protein